MPASCARSSGLAIVIAVIWGLAWILRQVKAGRDPQVSSAGPASVAALTLEHWALRAPGARRQRLRAARRAPSRASCRSTATPRGGARSGPARCSTKRRRDRGAQLLWPAGRLGRARALRAASRRVAGNGHRPDPMRMPSPLLAVLLERVRGTDGAPVEPQLLKRRADPAADRRAHARARRAVHGHRLQPHPDRARLHPHRGRHQQRAAQPGARRASRCS